MEYDKEGADTSKFQTNLNIAQFAGLVKNKKPLNRVHSILVVIWLIAGFFHYLLKLVMDLSKMDMLMTMESVHWLLVYILTTICSTLLLVNSSNTLWMHETVLKGFYKYTEPLSKEQVNIRTNENNEIVRYTKSFTTVIFIALPVSFLKEPLFGSRPGFRLPFPGWFPFEVNSWPRYVGAVGFQAIMGSNVTTCACTFVVLLISLAGHLCAQLEILDMAIQNLFSAPKTKQLKETNMDEVIRLRIKSIVQHHLIIIRYYLLIRTEENPTWFLETLQSTYSAIFLSISISTGLMLCTLGYLITDPDSTFITIAASISVFIPETFISVTYCWYGQRISDLSSNLGETIYQSAWYKETPRVQRSLLLILIRCKKPLILTGYGLQNMNLEGLKDILQASYTYFNMLIAVRGKK